MSAAPHPFARAPAIAVAAVGAAELATLLALCREHALRGGALPHEDAALALREALLDPPRRAWAWLARLDAAAVGYACATPGLALPRGGYCFRVDALYARPGPHAPAIEAALRGQVRAMAARLGCTALRWHDAAYEEPPRREAG
ncbi:hypothetical protein [Vulcaniibacterium tengchongense]|uniref:Uncharacterized protein n=1 Tax=Vulcaniibacterium tengchongense TaxID=1273429 RepID=A0A3N4VBZ2_9GAMM|nr:hypothetical protein [Vulcaniibacterium tengchongense]RPE80138.1 hypothetical protein EDC50_1970 [Vulcaniibacterium tengchongense]